MLVTLVLVSVPARGEEGSLRAALSRLALEGVTFTASEADDASVVIRGEAADYDAVSAFMRAVRNVVWSSDGYAQIVERHRDDTVLLRLLRDGAATLVLPERQVVAVTVSLRDASLSPGKRIAFELVARLSRRPTRWSSLPIAEDPALPAEVRSLWSSRDPKDEERIGRSLADCIQRTPKVASCWLALARLHARKGSTARAKEAYERFVELVPEGLGDEPGPRFMPWVDYPTPAKP